MKKFFYYGLVSIGLYVGGVWLGGALWSDYNHVKQAISELIMPSSPNQDIMQPIFWLYNLFLGAFSLGFLKWAPNKHLKLSAIFLMLCAISGMILLVFPQDEIGAQLTPSGLVHLIFAGVTSIATLLAMFLAGFGFRKLKDFRIQKNISFVLGAIVLVSGPLTAFAITQFPDHFGIFERVTIGAFIIWVYLLSYLFYKSRAFNNR